MMPSSLHIETTNRCNANCDFCYHPRMRRPLADMTEPLFRKVVQDAKALKLQTILPFIHGEMFLDRFIFDRLRHINEELPETDIAIFTNASLLDEGRISSLSAIRNISLINCSLNGYDPADYKKRTGLNFEAVVNNIRNLALANQERNFCREICVASVEIGRELGKNNKAYNDNFTAFVKKSFPGATIKVGAKMNYLGRIFSSRKIQNHRCPRLESMYVLTNGLVSLCCMDMDGEYILGNVNDRSLQDIYTGGMAQMYRRLKRKHLNPCMHCNMI